jgi:hypothetical protein
MSTPCTELEDIGTLCLIHEAGIQDIVLLSKADLLREEDRLASIEYIQSQNSRSTAARDAVQLSKLLKSGVFDMNDFCAILFTKI